MHPCTTHAPPLHRCHTRRGLPVDPSPILTPPNVYATALHDTAAPYLHRQMLCSGLAIFLKKVVNLFSDHVRRSGTKRSWQFSVDLLRRNDFHVDSVEFKFVSVFRRKTRKKNFRVKDFTTSSRRKFVGVGVSIECPSNSRQVIF